MATVPERLESLRVDLAGLRRRGVDLHTVEGVLPVDWLATVLGDTDAEVERPGRVELRVMLQPEGVVVVQGPLSLDFSVPCGRCLSPAAVDGSGEIFATFLPTDEIPPDQDEDDEEPDPDEPDLWPYEGPSLALDPMVAEQVALAYPMRALCERGEACRGLCSNCGYELNEAPAGALRCPQCKGEVQLLPVGDPPALGTQEREEREPSPLAEALRKLKLP